MYKATSSRPWRSTSWSSGSSARPGAKAPRDWLSK